MLYIKLFIEREKNIGQSAPECPFKAPGSTHITPILKSLHWLKVNECIELRNFSPSLTKFLQLLTT